MVKRKKGASIGEKISKLRKERGLSLSELAKEAGLSADLLKDIEAGESLPPVSVLLRLAKALAIDSTSLLVEEEELSEKRRERFIKRTQEYSYEVLTPRAEDKHLKAFLVTIDPMQAHKMVDYSHEGEEFIYVLEGKIEVVVGDNPNVLGKGESIHFDSEIVHRLRNLSEEPAKLIVVIYTP